MKGPNESLPRKANYGNTQNKYECVVRQVKAQYYKEWKDSKKTEITLKN